MSDTPETSRTGTMLFVGLGLIAVVALIAFVVMPLLTGGDDADEEFTADQSEGTFDDTVVDDQQVVQDDTGVESETEADDTEGEPAAETFEVFNARDPFDQLVDDSAGGGGTGDGAVPPDTTGGGTTTPPTGGGTTTPPTGGGTTTPPPDTSGGNGSTGNGTGGTNGSTGGTGGGGGGNGSDAQVGGTNVTLVDVFDDDGERKATVTVNGTGYTVGEGETFGRRFRLLDISGRCATMLFGDSRFTLCEGERIRK